MKVCLTSIAPVGFIEIYEDGAYRTGTDSVSSRRAMLSAKWREQKHEIVPLGALLPMLDLDSMRGVTDDRRCAHDTSDPRVPALLAAMRETPTDARETFRHAALLEGYWEQLNPSSEERPVHRRLFQVFNDSVHEEIVGRLVLDESPTLQGSWRGYAEMSLGERGFFRMELLPRNVDPDHRTHVQMLNTFMKELDAWCKAWGERLAPGLDTAPFKIHVDKVWSEDRGVVDKGCVSFHLDRDVSPVVLERAIRKADGDDAALDFYDPEKKCGRWYLVDADSQHKAGDVIAAGQ